MSQRKTKVMIGDFETTVYDKQEKTEVWASGVCELYTEDAHLFHSIDETFQYLKSLKSNITIYYHNLKFDGNFWISYLLKDLKYDTALNVYDKNGVLILNPTNEDIINPENEAKWIDEREMLNGTFRYAISDRGQWYSITVKTGGHKIDIRDSLKLLPFSVNKIGRDFKTKHKKLEMEYEGYRYAGCEITDEEKEYIFNDLFVVKEALEILFSEGHNKLTIGACCLSEFKNTFEPDSEMMDTDEFDRCGNEVDMSFFR